MITPCTNGPPRSFTLRGGGRYRRLSLTGEFAAIDRLRRRAPAPPAGETWIGDDAAAVATPPGPLLLATDLVVEGVHFDLSLVDLADVGWKALVVNVSDVAAMGGRALHALAAVAAPPGTDLDALADGLLEAAAAHDVALVGGDLSTAPLLVVSVSVTGTVDGGRPVLRSGARPGDGIFVTGPLGASAAALRALRAGGQGDAYRRPAARADRGPALREGGATAMIDVSDGLAADLGHIADESGVGFALDEVPVAPGAELADALGGGEDYEIVFTAPADAPASRLGVRIGTCTGDRSERTLTGEPLPLAGWEHSW